MTDVNLSACRDHLDHFFGEHPDTAMQKRAVKALRLLAVSDSPLAGNPAGWAAGIIYAVANRDRQACGVPGLLNGEFAGLFGVSMGPSANGRRRSISYLIIECA